MALRGSLAPGLLLAAPRLHDANFERSVVLIGSHDEGGALGWVLNGKTISPVRKLLSDSALVPPNTTLPDSASFDAFARVGGPVMPGSAWVLFRRDPAIEAGPGEHNLAEGYAISSARELVEQIARGEGPAEFSLLLGYAGWASDQLENEIQSGAWLPAPFLPDLLHVDPSDLWSTAYQRAVGTVPMAFTSNKVGLA
jgi:putative transcriptional regulator